MIDRTAAAFRAVLATLEPETDDLTARDRRRLKQPTRPATPATIFRWHTNKYTVFEEETDQRERSAGVLYRRVGVKSGGRLSAQQIATHEARLGITLPAPWRDVYRFFNGGSSSYLYWGNLEKPRSTDIRPVPGISDHYFALEDVAPLSQHLRLERPELDVSVLDDRLIALAFKHSEAIVLDYRSGDTPRVGKIYISHYDDDPLSAIYDRDCFWWPNMPLFFAGLYIQDRLV